MYMSGLGAGPFVRAYIYSPAGSPSCPPNLVNGCYNTGRMDMGAPVGQVCMNPDAMQFADLQDVINYAAGKGESLREFQTVEQVNAICSTAGSAKITSLTPDTYAGFQPLPSPLPSSGGIPSSGPPRFPTGISTPTIATPPYAPPVIVTTSDGYPLPPIGETSEPVTFESLTSNPLVLGIAGALAFSLLSRR